MSDSTQHLEDSLNKIRAIFVEAAKHIDAIKPGCKIPATELANTLAEQFDTTGPALYPVLKYLFTDYPGIEVRRGAHGGLARLDPSKTKKKDDEVKTESVTTDTSTVVSE